MSRTLVHVSRSLGGASLLLGDIAQALVHASLRLVVIAQLRGHIAHALVHNYQSLEDNDQSLGVPYLEGIVNCHSTEW